MQNRNLVVSYFALLIRSKNEENSQIPKVENNRGETIKVQPRGPVPCPVDKYPERTSSSN